MIESYDQLAYEYERYQQMKDNEDALKAFEDGYEVREWIREACKFGWMNGSQMLAYKVWQSYLGTLGETSSLSEASEYVFLDQDEWALMKFKVAVNQAVEKTICGWKTSVAAHLAEKKYLWRLSLTDITENLCRTRHHGDGQLYMRHVDR